ETAGDEPHLWIRDAVEQAEDEAAVGLCGDPIGNEARAPLADRLDRLELVCSRRQPEEPPLRAAREDRAVRRDRERNERFFRVELGAARGVAHDEATFTQAGHGHTAAARDEPVA